MRLDVTYEEVLAHPLEAVWGELTNAAAISDWLMATTDFTPVAGARFRLKAERLSRTGWVDAQVVEIVPPRRMVWAWSANDGNEPSLVTFELEPEGDGTRLRLRHAGEFDDSVAAILRDGWPGRIVALGDATRRASGG